jgi:hypothetical protein
MEYFDFVKPDEAISLPEDPQMAFVQFVQIAQERLEARLDTFGQNEAWSRIREAKHGFQNVVLGAAQRFKIEPFLKSNVPYVRDYEDADYQQFRADLSYYITQIMLAAADSDRSDSVPLLETVRESIHTYIYHLRLAIDKTELPDWKKKRLHKRLNELEAEITRGRVRMKIIAGILFGMLAAPHDASDSYDAVVHVATKIMREIGIAKDQDDEQRQISHDPLRALALPRRPEKIITSDSFSAEELDAEIPF